MAWDIKIGEAVLDIPDEMIEEGYPEITVRVAHTTHPGAPVFDGDDFTANSNYRSPAYSTWRMFLEETGLIEWFDKFRPPPGRDCATYLLTKADSNELARALSRYENNLPPGWEDGQDPVLARLLWLQWWINWALKNCEVPGIYIW